MRPFLGKRLLTRGIMDMCDSSKTTIRTPQGLTEAIDVTVGVHQVSALSPFLFLLTMGVIAKELMGGLLMSFPYAYDIALIKWSEEAPQDKQQI
ncbi:unnamed protein product [Haemonchus placei]|uniref:HCO3_cotransp domain-containing protein n=1 Tax=Haemonchus placei TaxID=6290 RepID=A0A0N4W2V9_HAEPC|nr:unnamed protein product [Haemonchus placei]